MQSESRWQTAPQQTSKREKWRHGPPYLIDHNKKRCTETPKQRSKFERLALIMPFALRRDRVQTGNGGSCSGICSRWPHSRRPMRSSSASSHLGTDRGNRWNSVAAVAAPSIDPLVSRPVLRAAQINNWTSISSRILPVTVQVNRRVARLHLPDFPRSYEESDHDPRRQSTAALMIHQSRPEG